MSEERDPKDFWATDGAYDHARARRIGDDALAEVTGTLIATVARAILDALPGDRHAVALGHVQSAVRQLEAARVPADDRPAPTEHAEVERHLLRRMLYGFDARFGR